MEHSSIICVCDQILPVDYVQESAVPGHPGYPAYTCKNPECPIFDCSLNAEKIAELRANPDQLQGYFATLPERQQRNRRNDE